MHWCERRLAENQINLELALNWIISRSDQLALDDDNEVDQGERHDYPDSQRDDEGSNDGFEVVQVPILPDEDNGTDDDPTRGEREEGKSGGGEGAAHSDSSSGGAPAAGTAAGTAAAHPPPTPVAEDPSAYTAFYLKGTYERYWSMPLRSEGSTESAVLAFKARATDQIYIRFSCSPEGTAELPPQGSYCDLSNDNDNNGSGDGGQKSPSIDREFEVILGHDRNCSSTISTDGSVVA